VRHFPDARRLRIARIREPRRGVERGDEGSDPFQAARREGNAVVVASVVREVARILDGRRAEERLTGGRVRREFVERAETEIVQVVIQIYIYLNV